MPPISNTYKYGSLKANCPSLIAILKCKEKHRALGKTQLLSGFLSGRFPETLILRIVSFMVHSLRALQCCDVMSMGIQTLPDVDAVLSTKTQSFGSGLLWGTSSHMHSSPFTMLRHIAANVSREACQAWLPRFSFLGNNENVLEAIFTLPSLSRQGTGGGLESNRNYQINRRPSACH